MNNIINYNNERLIFKELKQVFPDYEAKKDDLKFIQDEKDIYIRISFHCQTIAGEDLLHSFVHIFYKNIENKWLKYRDELLLDKNVLYDTILIDSSNLGLGNDCFANNSIVIGEMSKEELREFVRHLFGEVYREQIEHYRSLENCDKLLNKDIEITDKITKFSSIDGLPYRKIFIAEAVNNPKLPEIKEAMRKYCDKKYETGIREDFEDLKRIKLVFEKLFGTV